jgi:hypothetical protein
LRKLMTSPIPCRLDNCRVVASVRVRRYPCASALNTPLPWQCRQILSGLCENSAQGAGTKLFFRRCIRKMPGLQLRNVRCDRVPESQKSAINKGVFRVVPRGGFDIDRLKIAPQRVHFFGSINNR